MREERPIVKKPIGKESTVFLLATFGVTWLIWFGVYFYSAPWLIMLGTVVPSTMGLILATAFGGKPEFKGLLRSALRVRAPRIWWFYSMLLFPVVLLCACAVFAATGGVLPPAVFPMWFLPLAFVYIFACMGPLGEELGWRGFLLKRLLPAWGIEKSALALGLIWSVWHMPLFLITGTIQHELAQMGFFLAVVGYFLYTLCISVLITVLYARTEGNLLLCMVFHAVCNLSLGAIPIILTKSGAAVLLIILVFSVALILKIGAGKRRNPLKVPGA